RRIVWVGLAGGLFVGMGVAVWLRRVAFVESLWSVAGVLCVGLAAPSTLHVVFDPQTAPVNRGIMLGAWGCGVLLALSVGGSMGYLLFGEGRFHLRMGYEAWLGARLLFAKSKSHAVSFITLLSVCAVGMGACATVVVLGVMNGFHADLRDKILGANAHVLLMHSSGTLQNAEQVLAKTTRLRGVAGAGPFVLGEGMVAAGKQLSGALIKGIDVARVGSVNALPTNMVAGSLRDLGGEAPLLATPTADANPAGGGPRGIPDSRDVINRVSTKDKEGGAQAQQNSGIIVGQEMAEQLDLAVGDVVRLISPLGGELGPAGPMPKATAFRVVGIFYSGYFEYDAKSVYISLTAAQDFFGLGQGVTGIEYAAVDPESAGAVAAAVQRRLGGYPYYTRDWRQMSHSLFSALQLEKLVMAVILITLVAMASLLILVVLVMVVMERGKEIAILKSMGATNVSVAKIFVVYGLSIGALGACAGTALGVAVCRVLGTLSLGLDPQVYYISHVPVRMCPVEVAAVACCTVVLSFLATVPAALFGAKAPPVQGLREG
ncbi:MAG: FtsX-like permease family protein, partial [Myxococcota bacterium]